MPLLAQGYIKRDNQNPFEVFHLQFRKPFSLPLKVYINTLLIVYRSKQRLKLSYLPLGLHIQLKYMLNSILSSTSALNPGC